MTTAGSAAAQPSISWSLSFDDPNGTNQQYYSEMRSNFMAAADEWSTHLTSPVPRTIDVQIRFLTSQVRSSGSSVTSAFIRNVNGVDVYAQGFVYKVITGQEPLGVTPDVYINFNPQFMASTLWFDPNPATRTAPVPSNRNDIYSVILHELTHAIAFNGWRDGHNGTLPGSPPYESTFDIYETFDGTNLYFTGPRAEAIYGGPVPITYGDNFHVGNSFPRPGSDLLDDLMNGVVSKFGKRYDISALDLAMAADAGAPINFIPGDANADGRAGFDDLVTLARNYGRQADATLAMGDFNSDGKVDFQDLVLLARHYGQTFPGNFGPPPWATTLAALVPEPSACGLLAAAAALACVRRQEQFTRRHVVLVNGKSMRGRMASGAGKGCDGRAQRVRATICD